MIFNVLPLLVGFSLLVFAIIMFINYTQSKNVSLYLIIILMFAGLQRFTYGLVAFGFIPSLGLFIRKNLMLALLILPIYYIYVNSLILRFIPAKNQLKHVLLAFIIYSLYKILRLDIQVGKYLFLLYSFIYFIKLSIVLKKYFTKTKTLLEHKHYKKIRIWLFFIITLIMFVFVASNYFVFNSTFDKSKILKTFLVSSSVLWFGVILYLKLNPFIVFSDSLLFKKINKDTLGNFKIWKFYSNKIKSDHDLKISKLVKPKLEKLIFKLGNFENEFIKTFIEIPTMKSLSKILKEPESHLKCLFKYYSNYSFNEYRNLLKIKRSLYLIDSGFLDKHTIESLSEKCEFKSRITFFNNFKKLVGYSPSDYFVQIKDNNKDLQF